MMTKKDKSNEIKAAATGSDMYTEQHGGHRVRTGRRIVDRSKLGQVAQTVDSAKVPNQYIGHTIKNAPGKFRLDGHKLIYHLKRVYQWERGERIVPIQVDMGLTKFCNIGCIYCIGVTQGGMSKGDMIRPDALLQFIKDCSRLGVKSVAFIGDGEPTLNPALYDAIVLAKKSGVDTATATNGVRLDMSRAHDILRDSTFIRFNLSAGDPQGFRRIHQSKGTNFNIVIENIRELVRIRIQHGYPCSLGIQMVLIPENFDQVLNLAQLGGDLGVDYLQIKQCSDTEYHELGINARDYDQATGILKEAEKLSSTDYLVSVKWNKINIMQETDIYRGGFRKYDVCYGTPFLGQISGNGKVYPCGPFFGKERFYIGDINSDSYSNILGSDRYWDVQNDILNNVDVHCDCTIGCRQDYINKFLFDLKNPPDHINFI